MPAVTDDLIQALAPDADTLANGRKLAAKGAFIQLARDADDTLLFGQCAGSGKTPYSVSTDFAAPGRPVCRCSCPSRKIPCKHVIGLLAARRVQDFPVAEIPEDLAEKRRKHAARKAKDDVPASHCDETPKPAKPPKKTKAAPDGGAAFKKKLVAQRDGLDRADKLLADLLRGGFGAATPHALKAWDEQLKALGDVYLPGLQLEFRRLARMLGDGGDAEARYTAAFAQAVRLGQFLRKGREALDRREAAPGDADPETLAAETALGRVWQLAELEALGLVERDRRLLQLAFAARDDAGGQSFEDEGVWLDLADGRLFRTVNRVPYKAVRHIPRDDSHAGVAEVPALAVYPGGMNPRVRWDGAVSVPAAAADFAAALAVARREWPPLLKAVKTHLMHPFANGTAFALVAYDAIGSVGGRAVLVTPDRHRIELAEQPAPMDGSVRWPPTLALLREVASAVPASGGLLLEFFLHPDDDRLAAVPLTLVTAEQVFRLAF